VRPWGGALALAFALLAAAPAHATLVYVKNPSSDRPSVYVAADDGSQPRRVAAGRSPTVSADGKWIAYVAPGELERVMLAPAAGGRAQQVARSRSVQRLQFSPNSTQLGMALAGRLSVHDIPTATTFNAAVGSIRGFSFSPDSKSVAYATAGQSDAPDASSDIYAIEFDAGPRRRVTRDRKSLNPLWAPTGEIVFDRQRRRREDAPAYNLFGVQPDGGSLRRITSLRIPALVSGLVPVEFSADGRRLLAEFVGQDTALGFAVSPRSGKTRALDADAENGFVGFDLAADGRTVLGHTGGPDPGGRHNVVTMPYRGGDPTVLVRRAAFPDWSL
jgi:Tol biopolymer transport system component